MTESQHDLMRLSAKGELWSDEEWRIILKTAIRSIDSLSKRLGYEAVPQNWQDDASFPILVTEPYLRRIEMGNLEDPLLLQIVPTSQERLQVNGYSNDPVSEQDKMVAGGVVQKYHGRVLLITTPACGIHCRYCFRKHFPYQESRPLDFSSQVRYIETDKSIGEVILSGGDPLILSDQQLSDLLASLDQIPHVERIRIHTRLPVVLPQRITSRLRKLFRETESKIIVVFHFNHPAEIDAEVEHALQMLSEEGVTLLNQSVLLRGVNDSPEVLVELSEQLFRNSVLPYYLHLLDKVSGTSHFEISDQDAIRIYEELQARLPGYLVPKLAREQPNASSKQTMFVKP